MAKKKSRIARKVEILVQELDQSGISFSKEDYDISAFLKIEYEKGIPFYAEFGPQKKRVGYSYISQALQRMDRKPLRPIFHVDKDLFKILLKGQDDFFFIMDDLAKLLVECQGRESLGREQAVQEKPDLEIKYKGTRFKEILREL
jgi:hypothetical protein